MIGSARRRSIRPERMSVATPTDDAREHPDHRLGEDPGHQVGVVVAAAGTSIALPKTYANSSTKRRHHDRADELLGDARDVAQAAAGEQPDLVERGGHARREREERVVEGGLGQRRLFHVQALQLGEDRAQVTGPLGAATDRRACGVDLRGEPPSRPPPPRPRRA